MTEATPFLRKYDITFLCPPTIRARYFVVHHVGANPNTFVYPGGIGIIRLLTRK